MTDLFNEKIGISVEGLSNKEHDTYMRQKDVTLIGCYMMTKRNFNMLRL